MTPLFNLTRRAFVTTGPVLCLAMMLIAACQRPPEKEVNMPQRDIKTVMDAHVDSLMAIPGVVGVAIGALEDGTPYIMVMVKAESEELERAIPDELEGYPVRIRVTGEIRPMRPQ